MILMSGLPEIQEAIAKLSMPDLEKILAATLSGMTVDEFGSEVKKWLATAKHPWWKRPYTDREPAVWFHEIFRTDGTPYSEQEAAFIRKIVGTR